MTTGKKLEDFNMNTLQVKASKRDYTVSIGFDLRFRLPDFLEKDYSKILIVTDDIVAPLYLDDVLKGVPKADSYTIPSGESSKSMEMYEKIQTYLLSNHFDRDGLIIALGGGVVGDLAGFVAATYMRGIDYVQVPTTILAHDSSVGGKVAINHTLGKNMIGSFYPPVAVVYDVNTLATLSDAEIRSGYAELIKEAFIQDANFLDELLEMKLSHITDEDLMRHLYKGIEIKAHIVEQDERETNIRKYLNFGHTLAHALETELGYGTITHGEAVAIGMQFALTLSEQFYDSKFPVEAYRKWLDRNQFPPITIPLQESAIINHMKHDKKAHNQLLQFIILEQTAHPVIKDLSEQDIQTALQSFLKGLNES